MQNCIFICTKLFHAVNLFSTVWDFAKQTFFFKFEDVFFEDQRIKYKLNRILFPSCLAFFIFLFAFHSTSWIYNISWVISKHRCRWNFIVNHYFYVTLWRKYYTNDIMYHNKWYMKWIFPGKKKRLLALGSILLSQITIYCVIECWK